MGPARQLVAAGIMWKYIQRNAEHIGDVTGTYLKKSLSRQQWSAFLEALKDDKLRKEYDRRCWAMEARMAALPPDAVFHAHHTGDWSVIARMLRQESERTTADTIGWIKYTVLRK